MKEAPVQARPNAPSAQSGSTADITDLYDVARANLDINSAVLAAIRIETILVVLVILNLIGLTIAAYVVMRKK